MTDPSRQIHDLYGKFARIGTFFRNVSKTLSILTEISNFQEVPGPDMGKGRDGTVPRFFVPVPKYQDSLSRGILIAGLFRRFCPRPNCLVALSPGSDHGYSRDGTGISTLSRDNRPFLARPVFIFVK